MFKFFLEKVFWWSVTLLAAPTTLILVSWNAVPGDSTYKIKTGLEQVILGATPSSNLKSSLQTKYTKKRFDEVQKVLDTSHASESLNNFNDQLVASENSVKEIKDVEEKKNQTQKLISTLENISQEIEQKEQTFQTNQIASTSQNTINNTNTTRAVTITSAIATIKPTINNTPTGVITIKPTQSSPATISSSSDIPSQLSKTKEKIDETIKELKKSQEQEQNNNKDKNINNSDRQNDQEQFNTNKIPNNSDGANNQENQKQNNQSRSKP